LRPGPAGTGKIGTITAGILGRGFGARLLAYDAYPNPDFLAMGGQYVSLEELLAQSDIVSLHCPLSKSSFHLIGAPQVAQMKRGAVLINTSRGGLMDTRAVIDGLENGAIGGLGMDVYEKEGCVPCVWAASPATAGC
jgi:D-lactate dehydrogenase